MSVWRSKKAFLYFGGAFILLLGGAIVLMAPYHYIGFAATDPDVTPFSIWEGRGFYPSMEIAISCKPDNQSSTIDVDITIRENSTDSTYVVNMTLTNADSVGSQDLTYEKRTVVDLPYGDYTVRIDNIDGVGYVDVSYTQISESRSYIVTGGIMNIVGIIMGISGYFVGGSLLPTGEEMIVDWGYDRPPEDDY